jgi:hypothetical protein
MRLSISRLSLDGFLAQSFDLVQPLALAQGIGEFAIVGHVEDTTTVVVCGAGRWGRDRSALWMAASPHLNGRHHSVPSQIGDY